VCCFTCSESCGVLRHPVMVTGQTPDNSDSDTANYGCELVTQTRTLVIIYAHVLWHRGTDTQSHLAQFALELGLGLGLAYIQCFKKSTPLKLFGIFSFQLGIFT